MRGLLICALLLISSALLQVKTDVINKPIRVEAKEKYITYDHPMVPAPDVLKLVSLGQPQTVSDLLWLNTIQYFGSSSPYREYPSLGPLIDTITTVDPKFEYPYEFGMIILPFMNQTEISVNIGERAISNYPESGLLHFYLGSNHLLYTKDYQKAHTYFDLASKKGGPGASASLAATALNKITNNTSDRLIARDYWISVAQSASTENDRETAFNWAKHMQLVYELENIIADYKNKNGSYPASFDDLIKAKYLKSEPLSPIERKLEIDPEKGTVSFEKSL